MMGLFVGQKLVLSIDTDNAMPDDLAAAIEYVADAEGVSSEEVEVNDINYGRQKKHKGR